MFLDDLSVSRPSPLTGTSYSVVISHSYSIKNTSNKQLNIEHFQYTEQEMYKHYIQTGMARKATMTTAEILQDIFEESDTELDEEDSFSDCGPIVEAVMTTSMTCVRIT